MTKTATPKLSMTQDAIRKRAKRASEKQAKLEKMFRSNPDKLAAEVAAQIRADKHANEDPTTYDNGAMHWFQQTWGYFRPNDTKLLELFENFNGRKILAPQCASTGCVFGWAATLAGYPMVYETYATPEDITDAYGNELIDVSQCWDEENERVRSIEQQGQVLLRLDDDQSAWLYNGYRSQEQVLWALDKIAAGDYDWDGEDSDCPSDAAVVDEDDSLSV